jgi:2-iminobutanoate/2-iminopropanoate deaminase
MQDVIHPADAVTPVGPYSPALAWNDLVFLSGQGPIDPSTGEVASEEITGQVRQTLANVDTLLHASGSARNQVLKVQVYLTDLRNFEAMNKLYAEFFEGCPYPARTTIQAAALPGGIQVEIDVVAYRSAA